MFMDLPVDAIGMHPFGPPPTVDDFLVANAKSAREWIYEAAVTLESTDPDHTTIEIPTFIMRIGIDLIGTYVNNLDENTRLMDDCIPQRMLDRVMLLDSGFGTRPNGCSQKICFRF